MKPKKKTEDEIHGILDRAIKDAVDFIEAEIAPDRLKAERYFNGKVDIGHEAGRSAVVATKCRDAVRSLKPALMRVFLQGDTPVEFIPTEGGSSDEAEQKTAYAAFKFEEAGGYRILSDVFQDAMVKKVGIAKAYWEDVETVDFREVSGLTDDEFEMLAGADDVEIVEHSETVDVDELGMEVTLHDVKIALTQTDGDIVIESVPPEEFFVNSGARNLENAYIVGHRTEKRVSDLVEMGFSLDEVSDLGTADSIDEEDDQRQKYADHDDDSADIAMRRVTVTEAYMRMDIEGVGIARPYRFLCAGGQNKILDYELCDDLPFAVFEVDPEPHTFFGRSTVDLIIGDQDAATMMWRGVLDNINLVNTPGMKVRDGSVNIDDLLNNEVGRIVRVKNMDDVLPMEVPFTAGQTLAAMEYFDATIDNKTGISRASQGLDPNSLQNSTATAVNATVAAATGQAEIIARNLAEGGMKQLFRIILRLTGEHVTGETTMRVDGRFVPINPADWSDSQDMRVNVGLGSSQRDFKLAGLQNTLAMQMQIWGEYGPGNGLVTATGIRNCLKDMQDLQGIYDTDRYFEQMDPEKEQMLLQQQQQQAEASKGQDPYVEAETAKAQAKLQSDRENRALQGQKIMLEDDRERDEMEQDAVLKAADLLAKHGYQVDLGALVQMQARERRQG